MAHIVQLVQTALSFNASYVEFFFSHTWLQEGKCELPHMLLEL